MKSYLLIFLSIFLLGCSKTTTSLKHFSNDTKGANAIQYTKKGDILYKNQVNAMFFATYLNKIDKKYNSDKLNSFIIGLHIVNKDDHKMFQNAYILTLNNQKPNSMVEINVDESELSKYITLKNPWAKYYLVHFDNYLEDKKITLSLKHAIYGETKIDFLK